MEGASNNMLTAVQSGGMSVDEASALSQGALADRFEAIRDILDKIGEDLSFNSTALAG